MLSCILRRAASWLALLGTAAVATGCATSRPTAPPARTFLFSRDSFAYANELVWEYQFDERGKWTSHPRQPKPDYTHRCFVVARSAKQFFLHARFDPDLPKATNESYRRLIRQVIGSSPRRTATETEKTLIPGYAGLREFSAAHEALLKAECGGPLQSYFQRGHWRMIFPFSRRHQEKTAAALLTRLRQRQSTVVHVVRFPSLRINHAIVLFDATESSHEIRFAAYDPNSPEAPATLTYDRSKRTFSLPNNLYFPGGRVDVYEIYRKGCY